MLRRITTFESDQAKQSSGESSIGLVLGNFKIGICLLGSTGGLLLVEGL